MERDINLNLIYIILILLLVLAGTVIFYQTKYENLKIEYDRSFDTSNETITDLTVKQKELYDILGELNVSENREYELASRLEKKNKELESVIRELATTQQELFEYQQKYDSLNVNYTIDREILNDHMKAVRDMQTKIDKLKSDVVNDASKTIVLQDIEEIQNELNILNSY